MYLVSVKLSHLLCSMSIVQANIIHSFVFMSKNFLSSLRLEPVLSGSGSGVSEACSSS